MEKSGKIIAGITAVCLIGGISVIPENINPALSMTASAETSADDTVLADYAESVWRLVNEERAKEGVDALTYNVTLNEASDIRAVELTELFSHERPNGIMCDSVLGECSVVTMGYGENIAMTSTSDVNPPEEVVKNWMNSTGHRKNILNAQYKNIGIGVVSYNGNYYWVQTFTSDMSIAENIKWTLGSDGVLNFSGTGDIPKNLSLLISRDSVKEAVVGENVKSVNCYPLSRCNNLTSITVLNPDCEFTEDAYASSSVTIYGYENSTAQTFAEENRCKFVSLGEVPKVTTAITTTTASTTTTIATTTTTATSSVVEPERIKHCGDVNGDGFLDAYDSAIVLKEYSVVSTGGTSILDSKQKETADVNNDGIVDAKDAVLILEIYVRSCSGFIEEEWKEYPDIAGMTPNYSLPVNGYTDEEIKNSAIKPTITVEKKKCSSDEELCEVNIDIDNDGMACNMMGFAIYYDENLDILPYESNIIHNDTVGLFNSLYSKNDDEHMIFISAVGASDSGLDGLHYTIPFKIMDKSARGKLEVKVVPVKGSMFTDFSDDEKSRLAQAYLFTQGTENGYIEISDSGMSSNADYGDVNTDGKVSIADAVLIMQSLSNPNEYKLSEQQILNADVVDVGDGITAKDALAIQMTDLNLISTDDLPTTSEKMNSIG